MSGTIASLIPAAIGIAISPAPIVELILVIFSRRRIPNTVAFVVTLIVLSAAAVALGAAGEKATESSANHTSTGMAVVLIVLGVLLLLVAVRNWRNRADTSEPKVFQTITGMGPAAAAFLALGATFVNPKNLVLLLAAGQTIAAAPSESKLLIGGVFVLIATAPYTVAAGYALIGGAPANRKPRPRPRLAHHPQPADHGGDLRTPGCAPRRQGRGRARLMDRPASHRSARLVPRLRLHHPPRRVLVGRVIVNALALALVVLALPGVHETTGRPVLGYLVLGALFGLLNAFLKPAIEFVALPLLLGSVGLVVIIVDVAMFWLLDSLTTLLQTDGAPWVVGAGVLLGLLSYVFDNVVGLTPPIVPDRREGGGSR